MLYTRQAMILSVLFSGLALGADASTELTGSRSLADAGGQECPIDINNSDRRLQVGLACRYDSGAIITNGLIKLGVNPGGELNTDGGRVSAGGATSSTTEVGLRYIIPSGTFARQEAESTSYGCNCEGWGARATEASGSTIYGWANQYSGCSIGSYKNFTTTANSAISVVTLPGGSLEVTHNYHPSTETNNTYEVDVTLRNLDKTANLTNVQYRRSMDWDIWPTPYTECSTIGPNPLNAAALLKSSNNGFITGDMRAPLNYIEYLSQGIGPFEDLGPADHGAAFDFQLGDLTPSGTPGDRVEFKTFYGAGRDTDEAKSALGSVGAEVYSLGKSSLPGGKCNDDSVVFFFGFSGVGGEAAFGPPSPSSTPSKSPTVQPSGMPSSEPSSDPSSSPSDMPSSKPSSAPSSEPSSKPSSSPSGQPSSAPSVRPSNEPTVLPSSSPSQQPSSMPSDAPSDTPTNVPSSFPSNQPSLVPSTTPSSSPSSEPSKQCENECTTGKSKSNSTTTDKSSGTTDKSSSSRTGESGCLYYRYKKMEEAIHHMQTKRLDGASPSGSHDLPKCEYRCIPESALPSPSFPKEFIHTKGQNLRGNLSPSDDADSSESGSGSSSSGSKEQVWYQYGRNGHLPSCRDPPPAAPKELK